MQLRSKLIVDFYLGSLLQAVLKPPTILAGKLLRRDHDLRRGGTVTIVKMLGGGSLVIAYPALLALKRAPSIRSLRILTTPAVRPFAEALGIFDETIVIRDDSPGTLALDSLAALRRLFRCDAIVDLEIHSRLTTVFALLTCARNRVSYYTSSSFWRRRISTHLIFCNLASGIYLHYDQIASLFGVEIPDLDFCRSQFRSTLEAPVPAARRVRRLALAPCCSDLSRERMLRPEEWIRILRRPPAAAQEMAEAELHLLGGSGDRGHLDRLAASIREEFPGLAVTNHAGRASLRDAIRLIAASDLLLCIDSALLHFARLLGVPTVSFWGPTDPQSLLRPWPGNRDEIHYRKLACSPCVHLAQEPPCGGNNLCMRLAADPDLSANLNPTWVVGDGTRRFRRPAGP